MIVKNVEQTFLRHIRCRSYQKPGRGEKSFTTSFTADYSQSWAFKSVKY